MSKSAENKDVKKYPENEEEFLHQEYEEPGPYIVIKPNNSDK